ncbi:hypothetical protein GCM10007304_11710 [Rhodococcoides trifolii]|uniref:Uncharacterized protein n=1 Tax=Rhodococcoides trifolii TaxID=908250 RepID=A0A917CVZ0_9NOCA|nr:hypothetical protein [Rhodococcus trifolii]GGF99498.1 hypothetical protein GCM10007304_11710 [Rhodococcus trifolii]
MTELDVDPQTYYDAASSCNDAAVAVFTVFGSVSRNLVVCGGMAGSDDGEAAWAASYDQRAIGITATAKDVVKALENYAGLLRTAGFNHAAAESDSTLGNSTQLSMVPDPAPTPGCDSPLPPSAGGPGNGLVDGTLGLVAQIGEAVPDSDTNKLANAAEAWLQVGDSSELCDATADLIAAVSSFGDTISPEVDLILDDLEELATSVDAIRMASTELADSCGEYRRNVEEFRGAMSRILNDLAVELGVTAAITVAASFITFGAAAAVGAAQSAHTITKFARIVAEAVAAWRAAKTIERGVKVTDDLRSLRLTLERLKSLGRNVVDRIRPTAPRRQLSELFENGVAPRASELENLARGEGWTRMQSPGDPIKFVDENGVVRVTIKRGSDRAPGSADPHVEIRDASVNEPTRSGIPSHAGAPTTTHR